MPLSQSKRISCPQTILLAGPHQAGTKARKTVLEEKGYQVTVASKIKDAVEHAAENSLGLVIIDFNLEHGKGLSLLDSLCETAPQLPTILLAEPLQEIEVAGAGCRADLVVPKQFDEIPQLLKAVDKLLRRRLPRKMPGTVRKTAPAAKKHG